MGGPIITINYGQDLRKITKFARSSDPHLKSVGQAAIALVRKLKQLDSVKIDGKLEKSEIPSAYSWNAVVNRYKELKRHLNMLLTRTNDPLFRFAKANLVKAVAKLARDVIPKVAATSSTWRSLEQLGLWIDVKNRTVVLHLNRQSGPFLRKISDEEHVIGDPTDVMNFGTSIKVAGVKKPITGVSVTKKGQSFTFVVTTSDGSKHVKSVTFKPWVREPGVIKVGGSKETHGLLILGIL